MKILTIVGNRPQFIKLGVTSRRLRELGEAAPFNSVVVNTGQHYDQMLSDVFFTELDIEPPHYDLGMGSGHIVDQIGRMMVPLREIFETEHPDALLVYGDTNSTIAGAIVAAHLGVPVLHVEGGERLYRRSAMPEETNRIVTDHLSDLCLASSRKAVRYLHREGFGPDRVRFVGDPMYDIFKLSGQMLQSQPALQPADLGVQAGEYGLCTIHRAENTDERDICIGLLGALDAAEMPVFLPAHPRLKHRLENWGWQPEGSLRLIEPLGYFDFQSLLRQSGLVVTDSGGVGREAFFAGKPAIIPLESSAWIEAVEAGLAVMTGRSPERLAQALRTLPPAQDVTRLIETNFGAGDAGNRIVEEVAAYVSRRGDRKEGAWHRLGTFDDLPKPVDATTLSHGNFAQIAALAVDLGWGASQMVLDVTQSLSGAGELATIARTQRVALTILVDLPNARYNVFTPGNLAALRDLADGNGIAALDAGSAALLESALAQPVSVVNVAGAQADRQPDGTPSRLDTLVGQGRDAHLHLQPWLWHAVPLTPFESALRVVDEAHDALVAPLGKT